MALEWPADLLIMDESSGRATARNLNIRITGTLGVLLKAKRDGQIASLEFEMDRLVQDAGFSSRTVSETRSSLRRGRVRENNHLDPPQHLIGRERGPGSRKILKCQTSPETRKLTNFTTTLRYIS